MSVKQIGNIMERRDAKMQGDICSPHLCTSAFNTLFLLAKFLNRPSPMFMYVPFYCTLHGIYFAFLKREKIRS